MPNCSRQTVVKSNVTAGCPLQLLSTFDPSLTIRKSPTAVSTCGLDSGLWILGHAFPIDLGSILLRLLPAFPASPNIPQTRESCVSFPVLLSWKTINILRAGFLHLLCSRGQRRLWTLHIPAVITARYTQILGRKELLLSASHCSSTRTARTINDREQRPIQVFPQLRLNPACLRWMAL